MAYDGVLADLRRLDDEIEAAWRPTIRKTSALLRRLMGCLSGGTSTQLAVLWSTVRSLQS
jgi:hypothetical protein